MQVRQPASIHSRTTNPGRNQYLKQRMAKTSVVFLQYFIVIYLSILNEQPTETQTPRVILHPGAV